MRAPRLALYAFLGAVTVAAGCQSCAGLGGGAAKEDLQLAPKETQIVFQANFSRLRNTEMWRKLRDLQESDPASKKDYDDFVKKCNFDPLKQLDSLFFAFPQSVSDTKEFAIIAHGTFDEPKLVACAREQVKKDGHDLQESEYGGHKLYTSTGQSEGQAFATFLDKKTVVLAGKEWIKKVIDLSSGKASGQSAKDNADLTALIKRARTSDGVWGVGLVPQATRDQLKNDPHLSAAASMKDVFGSLDFAKGFDADINVDLGSAADANQLVAKANDQLADARKNPQFMMAGLNAFLDAVKIDAKEATFHVAIHFNQQQVDDLTNRVKGLLNSLRGAFGGGMGGQMPPTQ